MVALLAASMPCSHAVAHEEHRHNGEEPAGLCDNHACDCHSCDAAVCITKRAVPMERSSAPVSIIPTVSSFQIFILSEQKPLVRQAPRGSSVTLASIQTVQLLI